MKAGKVGKYGWFSRQDLMEIFSCTGGWFDQAIKPKIAPEYIDKKSNTHLFYGLAALEVWAKIRIRIRTKARQESNGVVEPELLSTERSSPSLERLRLEKFKIARIERRELEKSLVSKKKVEEGLAKLAAILRDAGEQMNKISPRCVEILNESLDKFSKEDMLSKL